MKVYAGIRQGNAACVTVDKRPLDPRFDLWKHSPSGFEWGYSGSGPAQLALAILADHLNDDEMAVALHHAFKENVIAKLPYVGWTLTENEVHAVALLIDDENRKRATEDTGISRRAARPLREMLLEATPLPWRAWEADNDKVMPTVRIMGRRRSDHRKEICLGRIDSVADAAYACHAATVLPDTVNALRIVLCAVKHLHSDLAPEQLLFCEGALRRAEGGE